MTSQIILNVLGVNDPKKIELDIQAYSGLNKHECIENIWRSIKKIALGEKVNLGIFCL